MMEPTEMNERMIKHVLAEYNAHIVLLKGRVILNAPAPIDTQLLAFFKKHKQQVRLIVEKQG